MRGKDMQEAVPARAPAHLWIVGGLATLWMAFGCYDYSMTVTRNEKYLAMYGPDALAYFNSFPGWAVGLWALGVWGGLAGSLLLLARSRYAVLAYAVSLLGLLGTTVYQYGMSSMPASLNTTGMMVMLVVIWAIALGLLAYARAMQARGLLR
ncbi:MAG TPA: hypothetical protein VIV07_00970 [Sphingomicrobium sp.]